MIGDPIQGALWSGPPLPRLAAGTARRRLRALHEPGRLAGARRRALGPDAHRLPAVRQRRRHVLRLSRPVPAARVDGSPLRPRRIARPALGAGRDHAATRAGHVRQHPHADRLRPCVRAAALCGRLAGGDRCAGLAGRCAGRPETASDGTDPRRDG
ncbi:hypothetical protein G6F65_017433 [Rhizopus arrhizus]|nr:hypothetical protein G6F65_017433 [Rhizopus arrhizus]